MAHPFAKILEKAIASSTDFENKVLIEAQKIIAKGYSKAEICGVLQNLAKGRIDDKETEIINEALLEICGDEEDDEENN